jgi:hypothetical protein
MLPSMPAGDVAIHEVLADEAAGYVPHDAVLSGGVDRARDLDLWLSAEGSQLVVDRWPGRAAYPQQSGPARLFALMPGQIGRYQGNFRFAFTSCACNPSWYYEEWLVLIGNGGIQADGFVSGKPNQVVDHRVHLYGGPRRSSRR